MSDDPYAKAQPGEKLKIHATTWNQVVDLVKPGASAAPGDEFSYRRTNFRVYCQNKTSGTVPQWGVLHIDGVLPTPSGSTGTATEGFQSSPAVIGKTPTGTTNGSFVIAVEPIGADKLGMAAIDGVVQCKLDVTDASHRFATPKSGSTEELKTASSGEAAILWKEPGTGTGKWGLVRIGAGAGAPGVKIGKITGTWSKGGTQTVYEYTGDGAQVTGPSGPLSLTGVNRFVTVTISGSAARWVAVASVDSTWHMIAAEPETIDVGVKLSLGTSELVLDKKRVAIFTENPDPSPDIVAVSGCTGA
jgi:hypothetical protein